MINPTSLIATSLALFAAPSQAFVNAPSQRSVLPVREGINSRVGADASSMATTTRQSSRFSHVSLVPKRHDAADTGASKEKEVAVGSKSFYKTIDNRNFNVVSVFGRVQIEAPHDEVLAFVKTIDNLDRYEPKLNHVKHTKQPDEQNQKGYYVSTGVFMFVPFRDTFSYVDRPDGFHSEMESGLLKGHMNGGFKVKALSDQLTEVYHYEIYEFSPLKNIMPKRVESYLKTAMVKELEDLREVYHSSKS